MNKYKVIVKESNPNYGLPHRINESLYRYYSKIVEAGDFHIGHSGSLTFYSDGALGLFSIKAIMAFPSGTWEFVELVKEENNG